MACLGHVPLLWQELICKHVAHIIDQPLDFQPGALKSDIFFPSFQPWNTQTTDTERNYSDIYKDLRSLSLVSKRFRFIAQRLLFRVVLVGGPRCPMRLLKSLLLYPDNRPYVGSLFVSRKTVSPDQLDLDTVLQFICTLRPLIMAGKLDQLPNNDSFRNFMELVPYFAPEWQANAQRTKQLIGFARDLACPPGIADHVLRAIVQLCPNLFGLHLSCGSNWSRYFRVVPPSLPTAFPPVRSLTVDWGAIRSQAYAAALQPSYEGGLPPTIERLTLIGDKDSRVGIAHIDLDLIYSFLRSNTALKELHMIHGFHESADSRYCDVPIEIKDRVATWNTIVELYRDTLEVLEFDGCYMIPNDWRDWRNLNRFGPTRMLSCLGDFKKLVSLKVPLHMLRPDFPGIYLPESGHMFRHDYRPVYYPAHGGKIMDLVYAPLPKSLKKIDLVLVTEMHSDWWNNMRRFIDRVEVLEVEL